jgi:hypothetical protein
VSFAPSVERARAEGVRVRREEYPSGVAGVKMSLEAIAQHIREGGADTQVQGWAMDQLLAAGISGRSGGDSSRAKMAALLAAVRKYTVYTPDPPGTEMVKSAAAMLCLRPNLCIRGGDCFPEGTLVLRDNWRRVPIEHIEPGQRIWGWEDWTTVIQVWSKGELPVDALSLESRMEAFPMRSSTLELTGDHKVYRHRFEKDRVHVRDLKVGDALLRPGFAFNRGKDDSVQKMTRCFESPLFIRSISRAVRKVPCWDISTSDHYVYLPEHDVTVSNCDDQVVLLGSLLLSVGIPVMVVKQTFNGGDQEHVLIEAMDDNGNWIALDPSTDYPPGTKANAMEEFRLDPSSPSTIGLTGAPEAEFISIGATPGFPIWQHRFIGLQTLKPQMRLAPRIVKRQARKARRVGATTSISTPTSHSGSTSANPYGQALTDLQNQVQTPIKAGDVYLGQNDYAGALTAYQAAGQVGATNVGPEIDLVGAAAYTQPWTQKAWVANGTLAALGPVLNTDPNAKSIATQAQTLVKGMLANYVSAIQAGQTSFNQGNPGPVPTPAPAWGFTEVVPWMLGAGLVAGLGYAYVEAHKMHAIPLTRRKRRR